MLYRSDWGNFPALSRLFLRYVLSNLLNMKSTSHVFCLPFPSQNTCLLGLQHGWQSLLKALQLPMMFVCFVRLKNISKSQEVLGMCFCSFGLKDRSKTLMLWGLERYFGPENYQNCSCVALFCTLITAFEHHPGKIVACVGDTSQHAKQHVYTRCSDFIFFFLKPCW